MYVFILIFWIAAKISVWYWKYLIESLKPPNEPYVKFFFDLEDTFFGYFDKRERLRDFGTTLSAHLTKKLWRPKKRRICWDFQNGFKIEYRISGCWDIGLRSLTKSENGKIAYFENARKRAKNLESKIFVEIKKSLYIPMKVFRSFFENLSRSRNFGRFEKFWPLCLTELFYAIFLISDVKKNVKQKNTFFTNLSFLGEILEFVDFSEVRVVLWLILFLSYSFM